MTKKDVAICISALNSKTCAGFDRIPVCSIYDARATLLDPMASMFDKIYKNGIIPEQWKIS